MYGETYLKIIGKLEYALSRPSLHEGWEKNFLYWAIELDKLDSKHTDNYLGIAAKTIAELIDQNSLDQLLATLQKSGARIVFVEQCFVLTDLEQMQNTGNGKERKPAKFINKTAKVIEALRKKGIHADDLMIYQGGLLDSMTREAPYTIIEIPRINRQIAVCDQFGEITLFSTKILPIEVWHISSKEELKATDSVKTFIYNRKPDWAINLLEAVFAGAEMGEKRKIPKPPKKKSFQSTTAKCPDGWKSGSDLENEGYPGSTRCNKKLQEYQTIKIEQIKKKGKPQEVAEKIVYEEFIGVYGKSGRPCICISPIGLIEAEELVGLKKIPKCPEGWKSSLDLQKEGYPSAQISRVKLIEYEAAKIQQLVDGGVAMNDSERIVYDNYIGKYADHGKPYLVISPAGLTDAEELVGLKKIPKCPNSWKSGPDLYKEGYSEPVVCNRKLQEYRRIKIEQFSEEGKTQTEAEKIADGNFVGFYGKKGQVCLCISPNGFIEAERLGILQKISKCPIGWKSALELYKEGYADSPICNRKLKEYKAAKIGQLKKETKTPEEAEEIAHKNFVGLYSGKNNKLSLRISPEGLEEAEKLGFMQKIPKCPIRWKSGRDLEKEGYYNSTVCNRKLQEYKAAKIERIELQGKTPKEAKQVAEKEFIGIYTKSGNLCLCISEKGLNDAEELGFLQKSPRVRITSKSHPRINTTDTEVAGLRRR